MHMHMQEKTGRRQTLAATMRSKAPESSSIRAAQSPDLALQRLRQAQPAQRRALDAAPSPLAALHEVAAEGDPRARDHGPTLGQEGRVREGRPPAVQVRAPGRAAHRRRRTEQATQPLLRRDQHRVEDASLLARVRLCPGDARGGRGCAVHVRRRAGKLVGGVQHHGGQALADALDDDAREDGVRLHLRLEEGERRPRGRRVGAVCKHRSRDGLGLQRGEGGEGCVERSVAESRGSLDEGRLSAKGGAPARVREARRGDDEPVESTQVDAALRGQPPLCCDRLDLRHHRAGREVGERGLATEQAVAESVHALADRWPIPRRGTGRVLRLKSAGAPQHAEG
mmetsp:Transcript_36180/g.115844  ORF Transcript_36180/g.115844 Transcript_36180/m.115844 type:complete len:340 (+) Transcript_36180:121-1140(+)